MNFLTNLNYYNRHYTNKDPHQNIYLSENIKLDKKFYKANLSSVFFGEGLKYNVVNKNILCQNSNHIVINFNQEFSPDDFTIYTNNGYHLDITDGSNINIFQYLSSLNIISFVNTLFDNIPSYVPNEKNLLSSILDYILYKGMSLNIDSILTVMNKIRKGSLKIPMLQDLSLCDTLEKHLEPFKHVEDHGEINIEKYKYSKPEDKRILMINIDDNSDKLLMSSLMLILFETVIDANIYISNMSKIGVLKNIRSYIYAHARCCFFFFANDEKDFRREFGKSASGILYVSEIIVTNFYDKDIHYYLSRCDHWLSLYNHKFMERCVIRKMEISKKLDDNKCFVLIKSCYPILDTCM